MRFSQNFLSETNFIRKTSILFNILDVDVCMLQTTAMEIKATFLGKFEENQHSTFCNYCNHYEVTSMIDSFTPTYGETVEESMYLENTISQVFVLALV